MLARTSGGTSGGTCVGISGGKNIFEAWISLVQSSIVDIGLVFSRGYLLGFREESSSDNDLALLEFSSDNDSLPSLEEDTLSDDSHASFRGVKEWEEWGISKSWKFVRLSSRLSGRCNYSIYVTQSYVTQTINYYVCYVIHGFKLAGMRQANLLHTHSILFKQKNARFEEINDVEWVHNDAANHRNWRYFENCPFVVDSIP